LFPAPRSCGLGPHLCRPVRIIGAIARAGAWPPGVGTWVRLVRGRVFEPYCIVPGGGLGNCARPACSLVLLAVSSARPGWVRRLGRELQWPDLPLARRNL